MSQLHDKKSKTDILNRLKRAEGQLRGIQRMIEEDEDSLAVASQMSAVRKALDSTYARMTVCFIAQELGGRLARGKDADLAHLLGEVEALLSKVR